MSELSPILLGAIANLGPAIDFLDPFREAHPICFAALVGCISGMLLSIPVGPVNLMVMNEGARRGFKLAILMSLGATAMEMIYCFIAFTGFASFFERGYVKAVMELCSFVFMLYLGIRFLAAKSVTAPVHLSETTDKLGEKIEQRIEERLHPRSVFVVGFVRVLGNPGVLVFWVILAANFLSREWVSPDWPGKLACVTGVGTGTGLWFLVLSFGASRGYGRFSEKTLLRLDHACGIGLLALATIHGGHIIWQMVHHQLTPHH
jgi:threonine/homoserine/homoserine lactone efflux protein